MNAITVLHPYCSNGTWMFDDPAAGLVREPFVAGVPAIIERMLAVLDIPLAEARGGFTLLFSGAPFPGHQLAARRYSQVAGGAWYETESVTLREGEPPTPVHEAQRGWLCPALFRYFASAPEMLYVQFSRNPKP